MVPAALQCRLILTHQIKTPLSQEKSSGVADAGQDQGFQAASEGRESCSDADVPVQINQTNDEWAGEQDRRLQLHCPLQADINMLCLCSRGTRSWYRLYYDGSLMLVGPTVTTCFVFASNLQSGAWNCLGRASSWLPPQQGPEHHGGLR